MGGYPQNSGDGHLFCGPRDCVLSRVSQKIVRRAGNAVVGRDRRIAKRRPEIRPLGYMRRGFRWGGRFSLRKDERLSLHKGGWLSLHKGGWLTLYKGGRLPLHKGEQLPLHKGGRLALLRNRSISLLRVRRFSSLRDRLISSLRVKRLRETEMSLRGNPSF